MISSDVFVGAGSVIRERYRIVDVLGSGGSATVFRAEDLRHDRRLVCLKLMHSTHPEGDKERKRFMREAALVRSLQHRYVVELLDYGHTEQEVPFLVFPLLYGRTLKERLETDGAFDPMDAAEITEQLLEALGPAHRQGVAHRDLKPANIFLCATRAGEEVRLLDFGLAKTTTRGPTRTDITRVGAVVGTPRYMAPEQARGERVGTAADIYALGLLFAEMLTGEAVVRGGGELDLYVAHGSDRPLPLPLQLDGSPFGHVIRRALSKRPEERYRVADQMLADLRGAMEHALEAPQDATGPELEVTSRHPRSTKHVQLSVPNPQSEKLREVFNTLAGHDGRPVGYDDAPAPRPSTPIALVRRIEPPPDDE